MGIVWWLGGTEDPFETDMWVCTYDARLLGHMQRARCYNVHACFRINTVDYKYMLKPEQDYLSIHPTSQVQ